MQKKRSDVCLQLTAESNGTLKESTQCNIKKMQPMSNSSKKQNKECLRQDMSVFQQILPQLHKQFILYLLSPQLIKCKIVIDTAGFSYFFPKYRLVLEEQNRCILSVQKKLHLFSTYFQLRTDQREINQKVGIGRFQTTKQNIYNLYDQADEKQRRNQLLKVKFVAVSKRRRMLVYLKADQEYTKGEGFRLLESNSKRLVDKVPKWNCKTGQAQLDFKGRAKMSSAKNLVLTIEGEDEPVLLLGKVHDGQYNLDFKQPLTPLYAMAIALANFDFVIS